MGASYEFWLTDDSGRRLFLLKDIAFASYSRTTRGLGTILLGLPLDAYLPHLPNIFQPDWRIDVWRSAGTGYPKRREGSYFLRKFLIYDRAEDNLRMIQFHGRCPIEILNRWTTSDTDIAQYQKTDYIDDMMKAIVNDVFVAGGNVAPAGEFSVDGDVSLGPSVSQIFRGKNVLDVLNELKKVSFNMNFADSTNRKIYFDVVEGPGVENGFGYIFRTYADLRGADRSKGLVFSVENGNLASPQYSEDYSTQVTVVQVLTTKVENLASEKESRWNEIAARRNPNVIGGGHGNFFFQNVSPFSSTVTHTTVANTYLAENAKEVSLRAFFLNTPGSPNQPRSLYGIDWDMGDLLPVQYAGKNMNAEVEIVWVSVDESGSENIVGANKVGE